jgi:hypothetical protein
LAVPALQVTVAGLRSLRHVPSLATLTLSHCPAVTDAACGVVAASLPSLTALHLRGCHAVSDAGVSAVAAAAGHLRELDLHGCGKLTDDALYAVAKLRSLTSLDVSHCAKLTAAAALAGLTDLTALDLSSCARVRPTERLGLIPLIGYFPVHLSLSPHSERRRVERLRASGGCPKAPRAQAVRTCTAELLRRSWMHTRLQVDMFSAKDPL